MNTFRKFRIGFTIIELMISVAIVAILAAIAIPAYTSYVRRSYLSEATTSISSIKSAEESYFTVNNCYISVAAYPTTIPRGIATVWDTSAAPVGWGTNALSVRPDRQVKFQYEIYASNQVSGTGGCGAAATAPSSIGCMSGNLVGSGSGFYVNTAVTPNWYIVVARGDLDNDGTASNIVSAIDDSAVVMCNELE